MQVQLFLEEQNIRPLELLNKRRRNSRRNVFWGKSPDEILDFLSRSIFSVEAFHFKKQA
jgi:hypothetical protein